MPKIIIEEFDEYCVDFVIDEAGGVTWTPNEGIPNNVRGLPHSESSKAYTSDHSDRLRDGTRQSDRHNRRQT